MARVGFIGVVQDLEGDAQVGVTVDVFQTGTTTAIVETMYADPTSGTTKSNPLTTNSRGEFEFWLDNPKRVDLRVNTSSPVTRTVDLEPARDAANIFVLENRYSGGAAGDDMITTEVTGDSERRFKLNAGGDLEWGSGSATPDTNLRRLAANRLGTDDAFRAEGYIRNVRRLTGDDTLDEFDHVILLDNTSGNVTATLPANPVDGQEYIIRVSAFNSANICRVARNGRLMDSIWNPGGASADRDFICAGQEIHLVYFATGTTWFVIDYHTPRIAFEASQGTNQAITTATETTIVFGTEVEDTHAIYNPASGVFTAVAPLGGLWLFQAYVDWENNATGTYRLAKMTIDGTTNAASHDVAPSTIADAGNDLSLLRRLSDGQTIRVRVQHDRGSNHQAGGRFSGIRVGD